MQIPFGQSRRKSSLYLINLPNDNHTENDKESDQGDSVIGQVCHGMQMGVANVARTDIGVSNVERNTGMVVMVLNEVTGR